MVESEREACGSVKGAVRRKEDAWKRMLAASDEENTERCMTAYREEKRKVKRCIRGCSPHVWL